MALSITHRRKKFVLSGELTIYSVREAADALLPKLRAGTAALDLAQISEIDGAGLQLLLKARRVSSQAGQDLVIAAASPAVRDALDLVRGDELRQLIRSAS